MRRMVVGCMTGTSIDAIDAALVEVEGAGLSMSARFVRGVSRGLGELAAPLRRLAEQEAMTAGEIAALMRGFSLLHAEVVREVAVGEKLDLVCVHGQTVYHAPPVSWQLFNPSPLVRACRAPVVFDLRSADLAAGGQGAPITPIADYVLFRGGRRPERTSFPAIVNLGGFVNITCLPSPDLELREGVPDHEALVREIEGGDVCACNQLLDAIAREFFGAPYDEDGRRAAAGTVHDGALKELIGIWLAQGGGGRSLGTGDEGAAWIGRWRGELGGEDLAATACAGIAEVVASRVMGMEVVLAGGGVRNRVLRRELESACAGVAIATDDLGVPSAYREAACFAVLGALCQDRVPITLARVTGVAEPAPVAGCWMYP